jgi:hypothetical protein
MNAQEVRRVGQEVRIGGLSRQPHQGEGAHSWLACQT